MSAAERRAAYLDELGTALAGLTPLERIGAVDAVRAHIDASLTADATDADAAAMLDQLGSPEQVAARVQSGAAAVPADLAAEPAAAPTAGADPAFSVNPSGEPSPAAQASPPAQPSPAAQPSPTAAATEPSVEAIAARRVRERQSLSDLPAMEWPDEPAPRPGLTKRWLVLVVILTILGGSLFMLFLLPIAFLAVGLWLLWSSPLWTKQHKLIGTIAPILLLGGFLPIALFGFGADGFPVFLLAMPLLGLVVLGWLAVMGFAGARRVDADQAAQNRPGQSRPAQSRPAQSRPGR